MTGDSPRRRRAAQPLPLLPCLLAALLAGSGCQRGVSDLHIHVAAGQEVLIRDFCRNLPWEGLEVTVDADPAASAADGDRGAMHVAIVADGDGDGAYLLSGEGRHYAVHGDAPLGVQYGYLFHAEEPCFWNRERIEAARLIEGSSEPRPGCAL